LGITGLGGVAGVTGSGTAGLALSFKVHSVWQVVLKRA